MFYHLLAPLGKHFIIFNLFNYISFRAAGATVTAILLAFVVGPPVIDRLRARKIGQIIRAEGPASHQGKRGTPTMGGLIILLTTIVPTLLWAPLTNRFVVVAMISTLWMGCIGFVDDYLKIVQGKSRRTGGQVQAGGPMQLWPAPGSFPVSAAGGAGGHDSGDRNHLAVLQVSRGEFRPLALCRVRLRS
jgi:phospho-N-acetylmuramoyl-pentapeptide-transferase